MVLELFTQYLLTEKHYAAHTIRAYTKDLEQYHNFLESTYGIYDPTDADHRIIRTWLASLYELHITPRSINRKISTLRAYYKYQTIRHKLSINPMLKVIAPKMGERLPVFVDADAMQRLFQLDDYGEGIIGARNKLVLEILYSTGIRLSELILLKEEDIDLNKQQLLVTGKRNKQRMVPFGPYLKTQIISYIDLKRKEVYNTQTQHFLITTEKGKKAYPRLIYNIVNKHLSLVTTLKKKSPHVLRHTFATEMLNNGADMNAIKEILGHANLAATQVYTHNTVERLKKIYEQAHPKA